MAVKSKDRTNVKINKNFIIRVLVDPKTNKTKETKLTSVNKLKNYVNNDSIVLNMFQKVLSDGKYKYTFFIRNRLKIDFHSK